MTSDSLSQWFPCEKLVCYFSCCDYPFYDEERWKGGMIAEEWFWISYSGITYFTVYTLSNDYVPERAITPIVLTFWAVWLCHICRRSAEEQRRREEIAAVGEEYGKWLSYRSLGGPGKMVDGGGILFGFWKEKIHRAWSHIRLTGKVTYLTCKVK